MLKDYFANNKGIEGSNLFFLVILAFGLIGIGASLILAETLNQRNPIFVLLVICAFLLVLPVTTALRNQLVKGNQKESKLDLEKAQELSRRIAQETDLQKIDDLLRAYLVDHIGASQVHVFLYDRMSGQYSATEAADGKSTSDIKFNHNNALVQILKNRTRVFNLTDLNTVPIQLISERSRLALLNSGHFVPLQGKSMLAGWVSFGPKTGEVGYTPGDFSVIEAVCDQVALAVERAQAVGDLERRIQEMNVLARIAQGINITVIFDDVLELLYAQTNLLIPTRDLVITTKDEVTGALYPLFYVEDDERVTAKENKPLPKGHDLAYWIIENRRAINTDDYARECRLRGITPLLHGIYAWIGVPLNVGTETIGVFSLGSQDPSASYSKEQERLLQSIADQAASAIVKDKLVKELVQRARQLDTLNVVARDLGSTLELDPLLERILSSAVDILSCEAGSLFLVDEETEELIFKATIGPVASDLRGKRLPPGAGVVGKAVKEKSPIIVNDVMKASDWFDKTDQQTGFRTEELLAVPMIVKDQVVGVIEVINKKSGLPFIETDQELLIAFAAQAAVAYENARLYTQTDQALSDRVEELSVMQRIDRELNTTLDAALAMQITLDWAMRQSVAAAGLIGVVGEKVKITAVHGLPAGEIQDANGFLSGDWSLISQAIETGQVQTALLKSDSEGYSQLLKDTQFQVVTPIRREFDVIGVLLLESDRSELIKEETITFLSRLCDHASIAIANAQLYAEIQDANRAKSDFVSMVSHELKTPMTSIKGYTDLIAAGAVGAVTETQADFLGTIRSNVDRMQTLVSDLADTARIEAGRLRLDFRAVAMQEIIEDVVRSTKAQFDAKSQTLEVQIGDDLPKVWGDRDRLTQILVNLVSNANKYSPDGGKTYIFAAERRNEWQPGEAERVVHVQVRDTGFGIAPENQKNIFQKFFRADDDEIRSSPGTGLGLNITKNLVEMQGGKIWFESEFRKGTTFHFTIPVAEGS